jgi:hypothetical protein
MSADEIPMIVGDDSQLLGRALTRKDGEAIVAVLNEFGSSALRQRILDAVGDAIEECFDGVAS